MPNDGDILFVDGFDTYNDAAEVPLKWDYNSVGTPAFVLGGRCASKRLTMPGGNQSWAAGKSTSTVASTNCQMFKTLSAQCRYLNIGFGIYTPYSAASFVGCPGVQIFDTGRTAGPQWAIDFQSTPAKDGFWIGIHDYLLASEFLTSSYPNNKFLPSTWYFIEIVLDWGTGASNSSIDIYVNGVKMCGLAGFDYYPVGINRYSNKIGIFPNWNGCNCLYDDIIVRYSKSLLYDVDIIGDYATGDGATTAWAMSSGTQHFPLVSEQFAWAPDSGYVYSAAAGQLDLYTYPGRVINADQSILAIVTNDVVRKDDVQLRTIEDWYRSGATQGPASQDGVNGISYNLGTSWASLQTVRRVNPATGVAWTASDIGTGGAQFGVYSRS